MAAVDEAVRTLVIVAMRQRANPGGTIAGDLRNHFGRHALRKPPDDVPMASLHGVFGFAVPHLEFFDAQMSFHAEWLVHDLSISQDLI
jgi:hypothetical protein